MNFKVFSTIFKGFLLFDPRMLADFFEPDPGLGIRVENLLHEINGPFLEIFRVLHLRCYDLADKLAHIRVLKRISYQKVIKRAQKKSTKNSKKSKKNSFLDSPPVRQL